MTRHLLEIGDRSRDKEKGLGLVTQKADMNDLRKHRAYVTTLGKSTMNKVINAALQRALQVMPKPQPPKDTGQRPDSDALSLRPIVEHGKCRA